ncbi:MAG: PAS domain-containing protein [Phycisphaerae bacterium]|nr:PAS domain-containing protein [Phycisphaerae bacterium]
MDRSSGRDNERRTGGAAPKDAEPRASRSGGDWTGVIDELHSEVRDRMTAEESLRRHAAVLREQAELLDLAHDAILVHDMDGRVVFWNRAAERMYGWSRGEAIGQSAHMLLRTQFGVSMTELHRRLHDEDRWEGRVTHTARTGERLVVESRWALRRDVSGEPLAVLEIDTDVTERHRMEQQLQRSEHLLAEAQRIAHVGHWDWDIPAETLTWSDEVYRLFGLAPGAFEPTYKVFLSYVHPDDRPAVEEAVRAALERGQTYGIDHRVVGDDGTVRHVHEQAVVSYDEAGRAVRMTGTVQDITQRKLAERAGAEARRFAESIVETIREPLLVLDDQLRVVSANGAFYERFCAAPEQTRRRPIHELGNGQWDIPELNRLLLRVLDRDETIEDYEVTHDFEHIGLRTMVLNARRIRRRKRTRLILLAMDDVTERKAALEALERERQRLYAVLDMLPGWVCLVGRDYHYRYTNHRFRDTFGAPAGRPCYEVQFVRTGPCQSCRLRRVIDGQRPDRWEHAAGSDRERRSFEVWAYPFTDIDGTPVVLELGIDVTDRKRLERLVMETSQLERRSIGRDLHDTLGQDLTALGFLMRGFADRVCMKFPDELDAADQIVELVNQAVTKVRALARGLDPVGLHEDGIAAGLGELAHSTEQVFDVTCGCRCDEGVTGGEEAVLTNLYHIAQEAVTNAVKHAEAGRIDIALRRDDDEVVLTVTDDGVGLGDEPHRSKGMGLGIMRYRAGVMDATLQVGPGEAGGTCVKVSVPVERYTREKPGE